MNSKRFTSESPRDYRILVVDDNEGMRRVLFLLLTSLGYRVVLAENGQQAFELFSRGSFSLILTDRYMPEMDGFALAAKVKVVSPNTPIIMLTGSPIEKRTDTSCVDCILFKPFHLDDVHRTVESALAGDFFCPPAESGIEIRLQA